ncbi:hypothetical protein M436DRAFT_53259 [Aureobasidium namibiae CBS 147.97]|uniref:Mediator of RNA polymerase II transcription subunit 21 n=1 Tax=Aureobasidium namibiae CBS 147.97 TaxID=1043004 RepID=A0A074WC94_9PEZI|nr:uncharacterized protein M436DRAFT_53259 [Aureobasidium namibiae CBS 147.97]KEQ70573.1 hypothetical protein M436DRAFT_53259 [Aureobasidium namibiae CBS 147.97]
MADRLTQLQDCLDDLATQMFASIRYIQTRHQFAAIPDQPDIELARDLVLKEQQIEYLISVLPGIGESEANQSQRIQALEKELREADEERKVALAEREAMLVKLAALAGECKRVY